MHDAVVDIFLSLPLFHQSFFDRGGFPPVSMLWTYERHMKTAHTVISPLGMNDAPANHFLPITADSAVEMSNDNAVYTVDDPPA